MSNYRNLVRFISAAMGRIRFWMKISYLHTQIPIPKNQVQYISTKLIYHA